MQLKGTYKEIWTISYPIILGSLAHSINQLIDTAFLGHSSKMMNYALIPVVLGFCFNGFYTGIGKTKIITLATVCMAITNIIAGYIFIFGRFGVPPLGIKGAGIATAIADTVLFLVYLFHFIYYKQPKKYNAFTFKFIRVKQLWSIIKLSSPIVLQNLIGIGSWWYFFLSIEKIGEHELAVSGILKSLFVFIGIPVWSLASTSNTLISNIIGQNRIDDVVPALKKVLVVSMGISLSINLIIVLFPYPILSLFTNDTQLIKDCIPPFYTLMIALLFFSSAMIMNFGITGTGATFVPTIVELFCCLFYVAYCYYFVQIKHSPLYISWGCEVVYWLSLLSFTTFYWGSGIWRKYVKNVDSSK